MFGSMDCLSVCKLAVSFQVQSQMFIWSFGWKKAMELLFLSAWISWIFLSKDFLKWILDILAHIIRRFLSITVTTALPTVPVVSLLVQFSYSDVIQFASYDCCPAFPPLFALNISQAYCDYSSLFRFSVLPSHKHLIQHFRSFVNK